MRGYSSCKQKSTISSKVIPALAKQWLWIKTLLQSVCNVVLGLATVDMLQTMQLGACIIAILQKGLIGWVKLSQDAKFLAQSGPKVYNSLGTPFLSHSVP